jgi:8-oxo-dGTP diphosphatase
MKQLTNKEYNYIYDRVPRACVDLVITNQMGYTLLIKRDIQPYKGKWSIPGGGVRFRESFEDTIQRIAINELGQKVVIHKQIGAIEFLRELKMGIKRHSISIVFLCSLTEPNDTFKYFNGLESNIHPNHKQFIISQNK